MIIIFLKINSGWHSLTWFHQTKILGQNIFLANIYIKPPGKTFKTRGPPTPTFGIGIAEDIVRKTEYSFTESVFLKFRKTENVI